jgi:hypothetical protein
MMNHVEPLRRESLCFEISLKADQRVPERVWQLRVGGAVGMYDSRASMVPRPAH